MRNTNRRSTFRAFIVALLGAVLAASTVLAAGVVLAPAAHAGGTTAPPWEPDPSSVGGLIFYDAAGYQISGGSLTDSPVAAYVGGTATIRSGDTRATLYGYVPVTDTAPGTWNGEALGASTTYPNASAPAPLNASTLPLETGALGDENFVTLMSDLPNTNAAGSGYEDLYQFRLKTTQAGMQPNTTYDSADILGRLHHGCVGSMHGRHLVGGVSGVDRHLHGDRVGRVASEPAGRGYFSDPDRDGQPLGTRYRPVRKRRDRRRQSGHRR